MGWNSNKILPHSCSLIFVFMSEYGGSEIFSVYFKNIYKEYIITLFFQPFYLNIVVLIVKILI